MAFSLTCKHCGKQFFGRVICQKFCSIDCAHAASRGVSQNQRKWRDKNVDQPRWHPKDGSFEKRKREEAKAAAERRERMLARDAAFAAWERENGVADRVVESGGVRTVTRGQRCVGANSARFINHNS